MAFDKDKAAIGVTLFGPMGVALGETTIRNPCKETDTSYTTHTVRENANFELNNRVYSKDFIIQSGILKKYMGNSEVLQIPDGVIQIDDLAFDSCESVKIITLPSSVNSIGAYAFSDCINLSDISLNYGLTTIEQGSFLGCANLKKVVIPD